MRINNYKIPYRTECRLQIGNNVYYPDFTIRHPETGEFFYTEHLGLIEKYGYLERNLKKFHDYFTHEIIPMRNLILTFETKEQPLTLEMIDWLVKSLIL